MKRGAPNGNRPVAVHRKGAVVTAGGQLIPGKNRGVSRQASPEDGVAKIDNFPKRGSADSRTHAIIQSAMRAAFKPSAGSRPSCRRRTTTIFGPSDLPGRQVENVGVDQSEIREFAHFNRGDMVLLESKYACGGVQ
jgi:hypothetical protein